eukprot:CAMPEP_0194038128 /NCGR_PEP_ID=MMETSP0009_2-20130614/10395_1 /TAXON_ID=210454 /ORGANISM="Grammatophora oceanica, Strain CCMP 410" /LENGTH=49 /DNA_ID= /DNA_START= /DNA_END= /DNA_ORIENTATION=
MNAIGGSSDNVREDGSLSRPTSDKTRVVCFLTVLSLLVLGLVIDFFTPS